MLIAAFALTFTISDYYIFNRIDQFGAFAVFQWIKKAALLLLPAAVFFGNRRCADSARYIVPVAVIASLCTFGGFFSITKPADTPAQEIYNQINLFMPEWAHKALFFTESACMLIVCALLFVKYGFRVKAKSFIYLPVAIIAAMPLNIFENFFDITAIPQDSFLRFKNFTVWHFLAIAVLAGATIGGYYFLKNKPREEQYRWLCAAAGVVLLQYHSKDSMVMGDGYNVYNTVFACIPLFICNIGVYVSSLSVFLKRRALYATSFFVHAGGAISVFVYFGKDSMSNYGIFCSYSILYFCLTHIFLFMLCVLPTALGIYKFCIRDCIIPLIYYFIVIITASIASAAVTGFSIRLGLEGDDVLMPNYAFTQINPLPFEVPPVLTINLWGYEINLLYVLGLYAVYVCIFFAFYGAYRIFLLARTRVLAKLAARSTPPLTVLAEADSEVAIAFSGRHSHDEYIKEEKESAGSIDLCGVEGQEPAGRAVCGTETDEPTETDKESNPHAYDIEEGRKPARNDTEKKEPAFAASGKSKSAGNAQSNTKN